MEKVLLLKNKQFLNYQVDFKLSDEFRSEILFGQVDYYFDNQMKSIDVENHRVIDLGFEPSSFHTLPNGFLVIASYYSEVLKIYDKNFKLIKTIDKINEKPFWPEYLTSNGTNFVYLTDCSGQQIIKTDFNFNFIKQFGSRGSTNQQLKEPRGITFYEYSIYVCDSENKRIQKLSEDLVFQESYPLNFKPQNIKIIKNVACIKSTEAPYLISLYQISPFCFKNFVISCNSNPEIYSINSWFYVFNKFDKRIECYDLNGNLADKKSCLNIYEEKNQCYSFGYFNNRFIVGTEKTKKLKIL